MKDFLIFLMFLWLLILTVRVNKNIKVTNEKILTAEQKIDTQKYRVDTLVIEHNRVVSFLDNKFGN